MHLVLEQDVVKCSINSKLTRRAAIVQALEQYSARQLRLLFVLSEWDKPMTYGPEALRNVLVKEKDLKNFFQNVQVALRGSAAPANADQRWDESEKELHKRVREAQQEVRGPPASLLDKKFVRLSFKEGDVLSVFGLLGAGLSMSEPRQGGKRLLAR
jgi:hypothetical protein